MKSLALACSLCLSALSALGATNTTGPAMLTGTNLFSGQQLLTNAANAFVGAYTGSGAGLTNAAGYPLAGR